MQAGYTKIKPTKILKKLLEVYKSQSNIAKMLNLKKGSVNAWYMRKQVPPAHIHTLIKNSNGKIKYEDFYDDKNCP